MNRPDISVVIVSYNTRVVTLACVRSVVELSRGCSFEVILIDNDSKDGSVVAVRDPPSRSTSGTARTWTPANGSRSNRT